MRVLGRSAGARIDLWFTDGDESQKVSGTLTVRDSLLGVTVAPGAACPAHGSFKAQIYTLSGVRAFTGFAVRISPEELRIFPSGKIEHRERRGSVRLPFKADVTYRLLRFMRHDLTESTSVGTGACIDIGLSGLGVMTPIRLPEGMTIGVTIRAPGWDSFGEVHCVVARAQQTVSGWMTGLRFENPTPEFMDHVRRYLLDAIHAAHTRE